MEAYQEFKYKSPFVTLEDNFNTSNFNQDEVGWEAQEVQSNSPIDLRGGNTIEEAMDEQIITQVEG